MGPAEYVQFEEGKGAEEPLRDPVGPKFEVEFVNAYEAELAGAPLDKFVPADTIEDIDRLPVPVGPAGDSGVVELETGYGAELLKIPPDKLVPTDTVEDNDRLPVPVIPADEPNVVELETG